MLSRLFRVNPGKTRGASRRTVKIMQFRMETGFASTLSLLWIVARCSPTLLF